MKKLLICLLFVLSVLPLCVYSCGNEYEGVRGFLHRSFDDEFNVKRYSFTQGFDTLELQREKKVLEESMKVNSSYQLKSNYSLVLLKLGYHKEALKILQELVKLYPKEYNIVANLGTAYELNGMVNQALFYIRRAVKINPDSHQGSEWIHVKILEAKQKLRTNPLYLGTHSILALDTIDIRSYWGPSASELERLARVRDELVWQLKERISFVPAPDPVVSNLLLDLGKLCAVTGLDEDAETVLELSVKYAWPDQERFIKFRDEVKAVAFRNQVMKVIKYCALGMMWAAAIIILWVVRKRRKKKKLKLLQPQQKEQQLVVHS